MHSVDGAVSTLATSRLFMPCHMPPKTLSLRVAKSITLSCALLSEAELPLSPGWIL